MIHKAILPKTNPTLCHLPLWHTACDTVFGLASAALALVFGVALGNVVRGVPLNRPVSVLSTRPGGKAPAVTA